MFQNKVRRRASNSYYNQVDPYDVPALLQKARQYHLNKIRTADRIGELNEMYGPDEISLDDEEDANISEMNTCLGIAWMATYRVVETIRHIFTRDTKSTCHVDFETGRSSELGLSPYSFDLGPHTRHFQNSAIADASHDGNLLTYKILTDSGIELDILEVEIPDKTEIEKILEQNRDVQAQILNEKCASLVWIFQERTQIILVTESSSPYSWTPQQWFRKILSDMALADSIMIGHPFYWHPVVRRRLTKAVKHFKKLYQTITDQGKISKRIDEFVFENPRIHPDDGKLLKTDVAKYKMDGKDFVKAMDYYPHTRTKVLVGNLSTELVTTQSMNNIASNLHENWNQFMTNINNGKPFVSLKKLVEFEAEEKTKLYDSCDNNNNIKQIKIAKIISEISEISGEEDSNDNNNHYKDFYLKKIHGSDSGLIEIIEKKNLFDKSLHTTRVHGTDECTDLTLIKNNSNSEDEFQVIKSADMNVKTNYLNGDETLNYESRWKDSVYSQSESAGMVGGILGKSIRTKSRSRKSSSKRQQQQQQQGPSRSEGFIPKMNDSQNRSRSQSPLYNLESDTYNDRQGQSNPIPAPGYVVSLRKVHHRHHEGTKEVSDDDDLNANGSNQLGDDNINVLKLGPSKTRYHIDHNTPSEPEIGPPVPTFNEPYALRGNVFGFGIQQQEFNLGSEIPPADADSLSALAPHGLNSRERLPGVVNQLGLETTTILAPVHVHTTVQQHRCGRGPRNSCNFHGAYHAVTQNKSLECLDLGQPTKPTRNRGKGKGNGNRCSKCTISSEISHSSS